MPAETQGLNDYLQFSTPGFLTCQTRHVRGQARAPARPPIFSRLGDA